MDIFTLAIYSVQHLHIPTSSAALSRRIMDNVVMMSHKSAAHESGNPESERIPSALSFLSIGKPAQPYPDTGESGETYEVETHVDISASRQSQTLGRTRSTDCATSTRRLL